MRLLFSEIIVKYDPGTIVISYVAVFIAFIRLLLSGIIAGNDFGVPGLAILPDWFCRHYYDGI